MATYVLDLDGTLCTIVKNKHGHKEYNLAIPIKSRIDEHDWRLFTPPRLR